jgi:hypothetical protein
MNQRPPTFLLLATCSLALAAAAHAGETTSIFSDAAGDAAIRRTDSGADCPINPDGVIPDLIEARMMGWTSPTASTDPYTGSPREGRGASLFNLQLTFAGLINPPGPLGAGGTAFDPFAFGASPVYGFLDIDIDRSIGTGGELGSAAHSRYLANVGRFGARPYGYLGNRAVEWSDQLDTDFYTAPQFERTGADFSLAFCGCHNVTVLSEGGNQNSIFEAGETWIVRSRFFKRSGGYQAASGMFGGSQPGLYDPYVNLRFSHDIESDRTTITLVWAVDAQGAAALTGQSQQPYDQSISSGNHASVTEAIRDLIIGAQGGNGGALSGPVATLTNGWAEEELSDDNLTDPTRWEMTALFGMPCAAEGDALFVWTDTGFDETFGDCNGDDLTDNADQAIMQAIINAEDAGPRDLDATIDGRITVGTGAMWSYFDLNSDGFIDAADIALLNPLCAADFDGNGAVAVPDIFAFLSAWFAQDPSADIDGQGGIAVPDIFAFLSLWFAGCP